MKRAMGVINLINEVDYLEVLHRNRCVAAVPFGGRYRLIDFILSSMVNSGMSKVAVFTHSKYRALMDHLGSGKEWDLDRKRGGLFVLPPNTDEKEEIARGDLYQFHCQRDYFHRSRQDVVVVTRSHMVCNINLQPAIETHLESGADITMVYKHTVSETTARARRIRMDETGRVVEMQDHNGRLSSNDVSMEIFIMTKQFLLDLVETSLAQGYDHFVRDAIMKNLSKLRVVGYHYDGYLGLINTIQSYYRHSMNLLKPEVRRELFNKNGLIYTKIKDEPPSRYLDGSSVQNALIANGCIVEGSVENCILFRGVRVGKGAVIRNSIILQNGEIHSGASIQNSILDKDVKVLEGKTVQGDPTAPYLAAKRSVIGRE
jgi:glucose-1-phosphate adenylyltransferase